LNLGQHLLVVENLKDGLQLDLEFLVALHDGFATLCEVCWKQGAPTAACREGPPQRCLFGWVRGRPSPVGADPWPLSSS
jgi:hypothetical protein